MSNNGKSDINLIPETIHETYYSHQPEIEPSLEKGISWTPLLEKDERTTAKEYGFSFGSKKVNMGPAFLNLDVMCRCLAKAVKKHLDYSKGKFLFIEDLQEESDRLQADFSYKFNTNLKFPSIEQMEEAVRNQGPAPDFAQLKSKIEMQQVSNQDLEPVKADNDDIEEDLERGEDMDDIKEALDDVEIKFIESIR